jgi:hypothetical protein
MSESADVPQNVREVLQKTDWALGTLESSRSVRDSMYPMFGVREQRKGGEKEKRGKETR